MIAKLSAVAALALVAFGSTFAHAAAPTPKAPACAAGMEAVYDVIYGTYSCQVIYVDHSHGKPMGN